MLILGIDQSLTGTGIALCHSNNGEQTYQSSLIASRMRGEARLIDIRTSVLRAAKDCDMAFMEGYAYGSKQGHVFELGELGGVLKVALYEAGIKLITVTPSELKAWATGKGNANKMAMGLSAERSGLFGHIPVDDNQVDALWMANLGYHYFSGEDSSNEKRRSIIAAIKERYTPGNKKPIKKRVKQ